MRYRLTKGAKNFARGGGYQSQIGKETSRDRGVSASMAASNDSIIPPLSIEYKAVERTADANYGAIALKLQDEATLRAEEAQKKANEDYMKYIASNPNLGEYSQSMLKKQLQKFETEMAKNMASDPLYYANSQNRTRLAAEAGKIVSAENMGAAYQLQKNIEEHRASHEKAGSLNNAYRDENGDTIWNQQTGKELTNQDAYQVATNMHHPLFNRIVKASNPEEIGKFASNTYKGTIDHSTKWVQDLVATLKPDSFSSEKVTGSKQSVDELNLMWKTEKNGTTRISNEKKIEQAKAVMAKNWQIEMGPEAAQGLREAMRQKVNNFKATDANGQALPGNLTFEQAMAKAQRDGNGAEYERLQRVRNASIQTQGQRWVEERMNMGKQSDVRHTQDKSWSGLNVVDPNAGSKGGGGKDATEKDLLSGFGVLLSSDEATTVLTPGYWMGNMNKDQLSLPMVGQSSLPINGDPKDVAVNGTYYLFNPSMGDVKNGSGNDGKPMKGSNIYKGAVLNRQAVRHVFTGDIEYKDPKSGKWVASKDKRLTNSLVTFTEENLHKLTQESPRMTDDHGRTYYLSKGKKLYVQERGFNEYTTSTGAVMLRPWNKMESYVATGRDVSGTTPKMKVYQGEQPGVGFSKDVASSGLSPDAKAVFKYQMERAKRQGATAKQLEIMQGTLNDIAAGKITPEYHSKLLQNLSETRDVQELENIMSMNPGIDPTSKMTSETIMKRLGIF